MGFIRDQYGRITIESRHESFKIHTGYGYDESGNEHSDRDGTFGIYWREHPHPEFYLSDLDSLIAALVDFRDNSDSVVRGGAVEATA